jgi:hypothetical protein
MDSAVYHSYIHNYAQTQQQVTAWGAHATHVPAIRIIKCVPAFQNTTLIAGKSRLGQSYVPYTNTFFSDIRNSSYMYEYTTARDTDSHLVCHLMLCQRYSATMNFQRNSFGCTNDDLVQPTILPEVQIRSKTEIREQKHNIDTASHNGWFVGIDY